MGKAKDMTDRKFGRLTVISRAPNVGIHTHWYCRCECGSEVNIRTSSLKSGNTTSCGCHRDGALAKANTVHGMSGTPIYRCWVNMIRRCRDPNNVNYKYYGAIGIRVCDEWLESFVNFYRDMGDRPEGLSIDRINVKGNYCKENCRWATAYEQRMNQRRMK